MGSNLERDIERKSQQLKRGIKELQSIIGRVYTSARQSNNNKLIFIKRNVDKLGAVAKHINSLDLKDLKEASNSKESTFIQEIEDIYKDTVSNIDKMQKLFKAQEAAEKKDSQYEGRFHVDQKNLDNLRLAHSNIRQMSLSSMMSRQDWKEIEKN